MYDLNTCKLNYMKAFFFLCINIFLTIAVADELGAQPEKEPLSFEDIRQWRTHAVTLSDNGDWYTTLYTLFDEPELEKDSVSQQIAAGYYQENNQTDVLYICHAKDGIKYKVPHGSEPVFSHASDWVAYKIVLESENEKDDKNKKDTTYIELKHLESDFTVKYETSADFQFLEDKNYFITSDKNSLLIYDLDNRREHYIGNIGEYLVDKKSEYIAYTISSEDKRGNGIYLFHPDKMTTRAIESGNFIYANLSWNKSRNSIAAYKYNKIKKEIDPANMHLVVVETENNLSVEYPVKEIKGMPENMGPVAEPGKKSNNIFWSNDGERLFIKIKEYKKEEENKDKKEEGNKEKSTVQVWHWKDSKLLSERIMDHEKEKDKIFDAIFFRNKNTVVQLTGEEIQKLVFSEGTDDWAIGTDNREYLSDWDVYKNDLYRVSLNTGDKKLIEKKYSSRYSTGLEISPDGKKVILWDGKHFWCYDFEKDLKSNISEGLNVSFVNKEYDKYGYVPSYGFVGWAKKQNAVIVNHKFDLWLLPLDENVKAQNLTASVNAKDSIRFRFEDYSFADEPEIEDRYIDLAAANILNAFHEKSKYAGFYNLREGKLNKLIYQPASFLKPWRWQRIIRSENAAAIIYHMGDYQNYPEAYLSTLDFSNAKKITNTNPQQERYKWGRRILIDYSNDDGVPLQGVLSIPDDYKKGQKLPMIVYSYEKRSQNMYKYSMPYLNGAVGPEMLYVSEGYLFLQPDIHFNVGTPHSDMHECIDAAIEKVIALGYVDDQRIGYQGFSFGGHCGMYISTQENKFSAIAAGAGVSNLVQGFNIDIVRDGSNEQDYYMTGQGRLGADPTANTEMYISESPVFNAKTMNTPLLLFHGTDDKVVQWEHSFGFYSILRYLKKPVVFLSYRGEGHGFREEMNRLDIQRRLKEFFDHYLKDGEEKKWMTEELPYIPEKEAKEKDEDKRRLPKWK
ncbi:MAG: prolyl oligopeptidase family serine peptidase [Bacteroidota bacterium]